MFTCMKRPSLILEIKERMFARFQRRPTEPSVETLLSGFSFNGADAYWRAHEADGNLAQTKMLTSMIAALAVGQLTQEAIRRTMPGSLSGVDPDILALDCLAWAVTTWQSALYERHRRDRGANADNRAWLEAQSVALSIKRLLLEPKSNEVASYWVERWREYKNIADTHERFSLLTYLLFTSKGHSTPMMRYPESPSVILDIRLGIEQMPAELACREVITGAVDDFRALAERMPPDNEDDEIDDE